MKVFAFAAAAALTLAACGGGGSVSQATATAAKTTAPTPAPTTAPTPAPTATPQTTFVFTAALKSSEENPPIAGAEAACNGDATVTIDRNARSVKFELNAKGCPADTEITAGHIHQGAKGANGPVKVPALAANEFKLTAGAGTLTKTTASVDAAVINDIIATPAGWYMNLHTRVNGGGVMRGQLEKKS